MLYLLCTQATLVNLLFGIHCLMGCLLCKHNPSNPSSPDPEILKLSHSCACMHAHTRVFPWHPVMPPFPWTPEAIGPNPPPNPAIPSQALPWCTGIEEGAGLSYLLTMRTPLLPKLRASPGQHLWGKGEDKEAHFYLTAPEETDLNTTKPPWRPLPIP